VSMDKIRKGDEVVVLTGKDKGKRGTVLVRVDENLVLVEGVNVVKKHAKPNPMKGITGGIVDKTLPIQVSNVALYNPATGKGERVGFTTLADGEKVRVYKSSGQAVSTQS
jgi:large subunit ribosomal protein L24